MSEKTSEELKEELENLKKENLEKELAKEKAKLEKTAEEEKEKEQLALREQIKTEVLEEMDGKSKLGDNTGESGDVGSGKWEKFRENYVKVHKLSGKTYEEQLEDMIGGGY